MTSQFHIPPVLYRSHICLTLSSLGCKISLMDTDLTIETSSLSNLFEFLTTVNKIKQLRRTGWIKPIEEAPSPTRVESVADHSFRVALMALVLAPPEIDRTRVLEMSVIHDIAESIIGDITPPEFSGISHEEKASREDAAMSQLCELLPAPQSLHVLGLFRELEQDATAEARFVHQLDKLEMMLQAGEYQAATGADLSGFFGCPLAHPLLGALRDRAKHACE
eukprot:gnl/Dysnectes_brevis/2554_a3073_1335.p1 GENE.gnl/Dysnectes_brevis/2554_a3073_1335~~gnl/Dysnectes_brevis/2554_a3073_1335.p1  ORF type:complete len:222 (-),score=60.85 gnl/Dysnectes_brevis/2554_a3073_1335:26-691(-)